MKRFKRILAVAAALTFAGGAATALSGCADGGEEVVLRVCNWEEYIDLGGWGEDDGNRFGKRKYFGENSMVDDFTEWFNSSHDFSVKVEYSTFGTNEDLYNRLSLGDVYDLVCPSDYMLMKLIAEGNYVEFSDGFLDTGNEENYYANGVSRYIDGAEESIFAENGWNKKSGVLYVGHNGAGLQSRTSRRGGRFHLVDAYERKLQKAGHD